MAQIEGIRIQNYRSLKDVTLGRTFENRHPKPLPRLIAIIGPNGCGKSTLMDALGFIGDCLLGSSLNSVGKGITIYHNLRSNKSLCQSLRKNSSG